jgi:hypothetical protein
MARRSVEQTHRGFNTQAHPSVGNPSTCPVCGETPESVKGQKPWQVLEAHITARHRPDVSCQRPHRGDGSAAWRLDWDAVLHAQPERWY